MDIMRNLSIDPDGLPQARPERITIGYIKKKLGKMFKKKMDLESDDETSELIFPTSFHIMMHPDDYQARIAFFERWGPIILARIYSIIRRKKNWVEFKHSVMGYFGKKYPDVKYTPTDPRWCIQFAPIGTGDNLGRGEINPILSYTIPFKIEYTQNSPRIVHNPNSTLMTRDPKTKELKELALDSSQILGEGISIYMFDNSLQNDPSAISGMYSNIQNSNKKKELATLQWDNLVWSMYDTYIEISGSEETRNESQILKLNSDKVKRTHVVIQYKDNGFQLAAWGPTMLNERYVDLSIDTTHVKWEKLNPKSTIVLNNAIVIRFKANSNLI
jgi:hypothetical protein